MATRFYRNPFVKDAPLTTVVSTAKLPDGAVITTYSDGREVIERVRPVISPAERNAPVFIMPDHTSAPGDRPDVARHIDHLNDLAAKLHH